MSRFWFILVSVLAAFAASAIAATSASAEECKPHFFLKDCVWEISGVELEGQAAFTLKNEASNNAVIKSKIGGTTVTIECSRVTGEGFLFGQTDSERVPVVDTLQMALNSCTVRSFPSCRVREPVNLNAENGLFRLFGEVKEIIAGVGKLLTKPFFTSAWGKITIEGSGCTLNGTRSLSGEQVIDVPANNPEQAKQIFTILGIESKLKLSNEPAEFSGKEDVTLTSGHPWRLATS
jgi:hypothetical protein